MTINPTFLGTSYLDESMLPALLEDFEGFVPEPYDDGKHLATIADQAGGDR